MYHIIIGFWTSHFIQYSFVFQLEFTYSDQTLRTWTVYNWTPPLCLCTSLGQQDSTSTLLWHLRWGRRLSSLRHVLYKEHETEKTMFVTYWCLSALKMGAMFHLPCACPPLGRHAPCRCIIILIYALNQLCIQILLIACHFLSISLCVPVVGW